MPDGVDALKTLHTALIDSRNGYQEVVEDAEGRGLTALFQQMIAIREKDADVLAAHLLALGEEADEQGSFMSTVHRTVVGVRAMITGLDESILPALIDGEERILKLYDDAVAEQGPGGAAYQDLTLQREALRQKIEDMRMIKETAA